MDSLRQVRDALVPLWHSLVSLVVAQARLSKTMLSERIRLSAARTIFLLHIWLFSLIGWIFLNLGVWRIAMKVNPGGVIAPFVVLILHAVAIGGMIAYYRRLRI